MSKIALLTYSTKPRGGVAHTLSLAEGLVASGVDVHIFALATGNDFFREVGAPYTLIPCPEKEYGNMDEKVQSYIDIYTEYLGNIVSEYDLFHAEDCISANALYNLRSEGRIDNYVRTIHHIDDFTSQVLIDCQLKSVVEPDFVISVSSLWQRELWDTYRVRSEVIHNGVTQRQPFDATKEEAKKSFNIEGKKALLSIGGIEPRKNTLTTLKAFISAREALLEKGIDLVWIIGGGETLFDYRDYRDEFFTEVRSLGLSLDEDIFVLGSVPEERMAALYAASDVFAFPSVKEGWGLVALESMLSGVPVIASNIEPMTEYLIDGENSLLISPMDSEALSDGVVSLLESESLTSSIIENGLQTAGGYSWESAALKHANFYNKILEADGVKNPDKRAVGDD